MNRIVRCFDKAQFNEPMHDRPLIADSDEGNIIGETSGEEEFKKTGAGGLIPESNCMTI